MYKLIFIVFYLDLNLNCLNFVTGVRNSDYAEASLAGYVQIYDQRKRILLLSVLRKSPNKFSLLVKVVKSLVPVVFLPFFQERFVIRQGVGFAAQ